jgi:hypothetical protein
MADDHDDLFPEVRNPEHTIIVSDRCMVRTRDGHRTVIVAESPGALRRHGRRRKLTPWSAW